MHVFKICRFGFFIIRPSIIQVGKDSTIKDSIYTIQNFTHFSPLEYAVILWGRFWVICVLLFFLYKMNHYTNYIRVERITCTMQRLLGRIQMYYTLFFTLNNIFCWSSSQFDASSRSRTFRYFCFLLIINNFVSLL